MASPKHTVLYAQLSQEDEHMGESNSIHAERGFENTVFLSDDGYADTNFDHPSWKKFIAMVEADEVEALIVKDMSRLGREYLQVGHYTDIYLPEKSVRFIAVNDGVDSLSVQHRHFLQEQEADREAQGTAATGGAYP